MTTTEPIGLPENPADFDVLGWLESGTIATRTVVIYNRPDLIEELEELDKQITALDTVDDRALAQDAPLSAYTDPQAPELLARRDELEAELEAARSVWTVRALSAAEVDRTDRDVPHQPVPVVPPESAPEKLRQRWAERVIAYNVKKAELDIERACHQLAIAVQSVETPRGVAAGVTVEALRGMLAKPHGKQIILMLMAAVAEASQSDLEVPRPTSPGRSGSDRA